MNGIDKFVREAMPIQEEEKASGKPAAKARPILKPSSTSEWDFTLNALTLKHWNPKILIVFKCQNSLVDYFDTVNKLIEKKMQESITTKLLMSVRKRYQTIQDIGQTKCRSNSPMLRVGQLTNGYQFWRKVEDRGKGFNNA